MDDNNTMRDQKMPADSDDPNKQKWDRIMHKGLEDVIRDQPDAFIRRARRGIPAEYRYVFSSPCKCTFAL